MEAAVAVEVGADMAASEASVIREEGLMPNKCGKLATSDIILLGDLPPGRLVCQTGWREGSSQRCITL